MSDRLCTRIRARFRACVGACDAVFFRSVAAVATPPRSRGLHCRVRRFDPDHRLQADQELSGAPPMRGKRADRRAFPVYDAAAPT